MKIISLGDVKIYVYKIKLANVFIVLKSKLKWNKIRVIIVYLKCFIKKQPTGSIVPSVSCQYIKQYITTITDIVLGY